MPGSIAVHDYALGYMDEHGGSVLADRRTKDGQVGIGIADDPTTHRWDVLVENMGRINYSHQLLHDRKGIVDYKPPANGDAPTKWEMYPLPMSDIGSLHFKKTGCTGPCFYRGHFNVDQPADTFMDTSHLNKGQLWVNGHAMGRFWKIGPQKTLYIPGPWLKKGENEVILFDVDGTPSPQLEGLTKPNLGD